jgi:hypothetical protein
MCAGRLGARPRIHNDLVSPMFDIVFMTEMMIQQSG